MKWALAVVQVQTCQAFACGSRGDAAADTISAQHQRRDKITADNQSKFPGRIYMRRGSAQSGEQAGLMCRASQLTGAAGLSASRSHAIANVRQVVQRVRSRGKSVS